MRAPRYEVGMDGTLLAVWASAPTVSRLALENVAAASWRATSHAHLHQRHLHLLRLQFGGATHWRGDALRHTKNLRGDLVYEILGNGGDRAHRRFAHHAATDWELDLQFVVQL